MPRTPAVAACVAMALLTGCTADPPRPPGSPSAATAGPDYGAGRSNPVADPVFPERGNPGIDVLHYDLRLDWKPDQKLLIGRATLRIRPTRDADRISLDFIPYAMDGISVDGIATAGRTENDKLVVLRPVVTDRPVTLEVRYHGTPRTVTTPTDRKDTRELGLTVTEDGGLWTMQEPYGALTWYPANDQPSDEALYDIAVTVPDGWTAVASGTPQGPGRFHSDDPVASYLTTLAVDRYTEQNPGGPHGLPISVFYKKGTDDNLVPSLLRSGEFIGWLEKRFGPYPFPTAGAVMVDSDSAMETQQMVTAGRVVPGRGEDQRATFDSTMVHEYAHHWFGDAVTPAVLSDVWLNEGWATYAQLLWEQERDKVSDDQLERFLRQADTDSRKEDGPPGKATPKNLLGDCFYVCAAAMLKELNDALGDEKFFALATAWVRQNRGTSQTRASFIAFVNQQTGADFTDLIDSWLDSPTTPAE